ncbi:MAG: hypothetical protein BECKG1743F_GA0114225_112471, partial [Candidatus Kentron sp. G]
MSVRSCLETRNLPRWRPNCVLASRRGQKLRRVVHYSPYFCPHRALHGPHRSAISKAISIKEYTNLLVFIVQLLRCNNSYI